VRVLFLFKAAVETDVLQVPTLVIEWQSEAERKGEG
jgi:hypothetical protein